MNELNIPNNFVEEAELLSSKEFVLNGYIIKKINNRLLLDFVRDEFASIIKDYLQLNKDIPADELLNSIFNYIKKDDLNSFRLHIINEVNLRKWLRPTYYKLAKDLLDLLVGNELVMQRKLNLSIQLPGDDSSLLNLHADTWSGDSPFEVVVWLPLVDCYKTKAMYILPPLATKKLHDEFSGYKELSSEELYTKVKDELVWIEIPYGNILLFNQSLPHGNRVNEENETRWTMNCRFKSIFTPYVSKNIGEFFEPITLKAISKLGMDYELPDLDK